ncbi:MAG TPA: hypothetical protein ENN39_07350 [Desulfonatronum sp.]|nr:hypothetical protein [Desulfonatronum sp.]
MIIALAHWQGRISPVFDVSQQLLLVSREACWPHQRRMVQLLYEQPQARAREVAGLGVHVLLCGAVSKMLATALTNEGVRVVGFLCGEVEDVLDAFLSRRLHQSRYRMPGFTKKTLTFEKNVGG